MIRNTEIDGGFRKDNILLGVTGSVASIKTANLVDVLESAGYSVRVMCTENAAQFFNAAELPIPVFRDADEWSSWTKRGDPVMHIEVSILSVDFSQPYATIRIKLHHFLVLIRTCFPRPVRFTFRWISKLSFSISSDSHQHRNITL